MTEPVTHASGAYRYLPGGSTFSNGLAAEPGYRIVEWELAEPLPLEPAFRRVGQELDAHGLGWDALAGVDLRSPEPFTPEGFAAFNVEYLQALGRHYPLDDRTPNPLTRTNVAPVEPFVPVPSVRAVQVVEPGADATGGDFVLSGVAEVTGAPGPENTVAHLDTSDAGLRAKVDFVAAELAGRLGQLGVAVGEARIVDAYTAQPLGWLELVLAGTFSAVPRYGLRRWLARPPVTDLEFELGCKRLSAHRYLD